MRQDGGIGACQKINKQKKEKKIEPIFIDKN